MLGILTSMLLFAAPIPQYHRPVFTQEFGYEQVDCARTTVPVPLDTPSPALNSLKREIEITFIIETDGYISDPSIIEGSSSRINSQVIRAIKHWRFRPATCNEVPVASVTAVQIK